MRYGMSAGHGRGKKIVITARRNNWRPTYKELPLPEQMEHLARPLTKVGECLTVREDSRAFGPLYKHLELAVIGQEAKSLAKLFRRRRGDFIKELQEACGKVKRKGLHTPETSRLITARLFQLLKEQA